MPYGIPAFLLTDNGPHFIRTVSETLCKFLGMKPLMTTANNPKTHGQAERYNTNRPSSHACVIILPSTNTIGMLLYIHSPTHTMLMYTAQPDRPHSAWSSPVSHLDLLHSSHGQRSQLTLNPKHHQRFSATPFYPVFPKCVTTLTSKWKPVYRATTSTTTTKCLNRHLFALVNSFMFTAYRYRHLLQTKCPWKHALNCS